MSSSDPNFTTSAHRYIFMYTPDKDPRRRFTVRWFITGHQWSGMDVAATDGDRYACGKVEFILLFSL